MILPAVRERLEALLRHPSVEGVVGEVRSGANLVGLSGLHDVAKPLVAAYVVHELRRPAYFITENNRRAEELAETLRFFAQIFPGPTGGIAVLPAFDSLPWDPQPPHADILERRAATLYRLANGEVSVVLAPVAAALWRYQDPYVYLTLSRTLAKDTEANSRRPDHAPGKHRLRAHRNGGFAWANLPCAAGLWTCFPRKRCGPFPH